MVIMCLIEAKNEEGKTMKIVNSILPYDTE
jgi:hypothetical protein